MLRKLAVLFFSLTLGLCSFAQEEFNAGIYFGPNLGQIRGDGHTGYNKIGGQIGGYVSHSIKDDWSYLISIGYNNKGSFKPSRPDKGITNRYLIILNYVEAKFTIRKQISVIHLDIGPYVGVLFANSEADEYGKLNSSTFDFHTLDFGGFIGVSYPINEKFTVSATNEQSLWPMANSIEFRKWFGIVGGSFNNILALNFYYHFK